MELLRDGEKSVGELTAQLGLEQPNVSQHFSVLRAKQIVTARREGNQVFYSLRDPVLNEVLDVLKQYFYLQLSEAMALRKEIRFKKMTVAK